MKDQEIPKAVMEMLKKADAEIERRHHASLLEKYGPEKGEEMWMSFQPGGTRYELDDRHEDDPRNIGCGNCYLGVNAITEDMFV